MDLNLNSNRKSGNSSIQAAAAEILRMAHLNVLELLVSAPLGTQISTDFSNGIIAQKRSFEYELEGGM